MHITAEAAENFSGFLIHVYPDTRKNRMYLLGRLSDGRSFAAVEDDWRPYFHIPEEVFPAAAHLLKTFDYKEIKALESFSGREKLVCLQFNNYNERYRAAAILEENNIQSPDASIKPAEQFLTEKQLRGYVRITGVPRGGRMVDVIIKKPDFSPPPKSLLIALRIASIDIETDVNTNIIRAIGIAWTDAPGGEIAANVIKEKVSVLLPQNASSDGSAASLNAQHSASITFYNSEKQMLSGFYNDIHEIDPDVLTGWNFLDFDFPHLDKRFAEHGLPFSIGRSLESAKFLPGDDGGGKFYNRRSSAALVPGRQVLDALRVMRAGTQGASSRAQSFTLDDVAQKILGEGKTVSETGDDKIAALDRLYCDDPAAFGLYCMRDADLVLKILSKTGLFRLTLERASLTGVSLDKAWTSVVSFERVYGMELAKRGIAPPCAVSGGVTGAAGGTVLDCDSGIFNNVAVFDFRSLYPTVIQTFNIDPLSRERAPAQEEKCIVAPNGARFSREHGLLPPLIAEYFDTRREAIKNGDKTAAQVYKILMNSFYGVLGTSACRYGKSSLAGAITSFARMWLLFSRDWFNKQGMNVLYGDTDSLFVQTNLNDVPLAEFESYCTALVKEINQLISQTIRSEYDLESFIELRFEKAYRRFLIPPVRNYHHSDKSVDRSVDGSQDDNESRGRAKGYGGYLLRADGSLEVEVIGMEAVRSDTTALARRLQLELLEMVFKGCTEDEYRQKASKTISELQKGELDHELVYRKRLARYPETYSSITPPHVKAARMLGWKKRRGTVEYLWTKNGPEPAALPHEKPDYDHYIESQIFPLVRSIAAAMRWDSSFFVTRKNGGTDGGYSQMEFRFST